MAAIAAVNAAVIDGPTNAQHGRSHSTRFPAEVYSQAFEGLDVNQDGKIELSELNHDAASTFGVTAMMIKRCDQDGDALIDREEFPQFFDMQLLPKNEKEEQNKSFMFEHIDADGDGSISLAEMLSARMLRDRETQEMLFSEEFIASRVSETDINGDGKVCFQEFLLFMEEL